MVVIWMLLLLVILIMIMVVVVVVVMLGAARRAARAATAVALCGGGGQPSHIGLLHVDAERRVDTQRAPAAADIAAHFRVAATTATGAWIVRVFLGRASAICVHSASRRGTAATTTISGMHGGGEVRAECAAGAGGERRLDDHLVLRPEGLDGGAHLLVELVVVQVLGHERRLVRRYVGRIEHRSLVDVPQRLGVALRRRRVRHVEQVGTEHRLL